MTQAIVQPTASQQAAAEALLADPGRWSRGRSKETGREFWLVKGSQGRSYFTTGDGCSCPGYRHRGVCSHALAATMREARAAARQARRFACTARGCHEATEGAGALCCGCADRKRRLAAELFPADI